MNAPATALTLQSQYLLKPMLQLPHDTVQTYYQQLYMHDLLQFRMCTVDNPTWADVLQMLRTCGKNIYMSVDSSTGQIQGEFMLDNFTGKAAQIHFSIHHGCSFKEAINQGKNVIEQVLFEWETPKGEPWLDTLYGLTPISNRVACLTVLKMGMTKIGILPSGMRDRGEIVDAMMSQVSRSQDGR